MSYLTLAIISAALLPIGLVNVLVTLQVLRSQEMHKLLFVIAIWAVPILGAILAFMGTRPAPLSPHPIGDHNSFGPPHHE